jgi:hypothetical protein
MTSLLAIVEDTEVTEGWSTYAFIHGPNFEYLMSEMAVFN